MSGNSGDDLGNNVLRRLASPQPGDKASLTRKVRPPESVLQVISHVLFLPSGFRMAYCIFGEHNSSHTIIYFNGILGSRLEGKLADETAKQCGLRLISFDRPGIGLSDYDKHSNVRSVAQDAVYLIERLGLHHQKIAIYAASGGSAFAAATCSILRDRVLGLFLASPFGPWQELDKGVRHYMNSKWRAALLSAARFPFFTHLYLSFVQRKLRGRSEVMSQRQDVEADRQIMANPWVDKLITFSAVEAALRHGGRGTVRDMKAILSDYGFHVNELAFLAGKFFVWHGLEDSTVPPEWTAKSWAKIPGARVEYFEKEAHVSTMARAQPIVAQLVVDMFRGEPCSTRGCKIHST